MAELAIQTTTEEGVLVVTLTGELDAYHAPRVKTELDSALRGAAPCVVLNLKRVAYIDSTGLGVLVAARKQAQEIRGELVLVIAPGGAVERTFTITGLLGVFSIFEDEAAALEATAKKEG